MEKNSSLNMFNLDNIDYLHQISPNLLQKMEKQTKNVDPIIQFMFNQLVERCINQYDFLQEPLGLDLYLRFFDEVNKHYEKKSKKFIKTNTATKSYFVGDIHGAIHETFLLVDFFYQALQEDPSIKIIFVGDYVDRNPFDLETLTLITAFHLLFPDNVILLRGNHETQEINEHYGFYDNLLRVFWDDAVKLYEKIIAYFKKLPILSVVNIFAGENKPAKVLVVHGGIPIDPQSPEIPVNLDDIEERLHSEEAYTDDMDPITISMLWSDPDEMIEKILPGNLNNGRTKFGSQLLKDFIELNQIDLIVRGHQKWKQGYRIFFDKIYSIFSTSTYDGKTQFDPKILRLQYGKSPKLIDITQKSLDLEMEDILK